MFLMNKDENHENIVCLGGKYYRSEFYLIVVIWCCMKTKQNVYDFFNCDLLKYLY